MNRNSMVYTGLFFVAFVSGSHISFANNSASASVLAEVVSPVIIGNESALNFGSFSAPLDGAVYVTINSATGSRTGTADLVGALTDGAARFTVTRATDLAYTATISYANNVGVGLYLSDITASCGGGATNNAMIMASGSSVSCAGSGATDTLRLGGKLTVGPNAASSAVGSVTATVAYN